MQLFSLSVLDTRIDFLSSFCALDGNDKKNSIFRKIKPSKNNFSSRSLEEKAEKRNFIIKCVFVFIFYFISSFKSDTRRKKERKQKIISNS